MKKQIYLQLCVALLLIIATGLTASAAIKFNTFHQNESEYAEDWKLHKSTAEVDIFQKTIIVKDELSQIDKEIIILKLVNKTNKEIRIDWYLKAYYGNSCRSCNLKRPNEYDKSFLLKPNQTMEGDSSNIDAGLCLLKGLKVNNFRQMDRFILDDLHITVID